MDLYILPQSAFEETFIRLVYVPAGVLPAYFISFKEGFGRWQQPALFYVFSLPVSGIFALFHLAHPAVTHLYLLSLILIIIYFSLVMRFSYKWSAISSFSCTLATAAVITFSDVLPEIKVMYCMLMVTTLGVTMFGSYFISESFRTEFVLTRQLNRAREKAEAATELKDKFVSLVSHDLRSPIGTVRSLLELAENERLPEGGYPKEAEEYIGRSHRVLTGLLNMINKLLDISRLQTGKIQPRKGFYFIRNLVEERMDKIFRQGEAKGISVANDLPDDTKLYIDCDLVGEVVLNLLSNAVKFTPQGGRIRIYSPRPATVAVWNSGEPVAASMVPDLFRHEVKTTTKGTAGEEGTGLGLPYCRDIMEAHDGAISAEPAEDGTVFTISFPDEKPAVLVVDDQEVHRLSIREELQKISDVDVLEAENGLKALEILREREPVLIITDLHMPGMDGFGFIETLKSGDGTSSIPVIVNSAMSSSSGDPEGSTIDARTRALKLGASDFVTKPLVPKDFVPRVKRYLP